VSDNYLTQADDSQVETDAIVIGRVNSNFSTQTTKFRAMNPDSRVRLKVSVMFVRDSTNPVGAPVTTMPSTLYLGEEEQSKKGGRRVLCTDILRDAAGNVIHQSAPLTIPEDPGLEGFTTEFVTAADSILGIFATSSPGGFSGHWHLQARWQPDGQHLCAGDWDAVRRKCRLVNVGDPIAGGGG
jgi:hypothetical protein